jgi:GNAT superfamily N-acetyltransferase
MTSEDEDFVSMCGHSLNEAEENPIFIHDCHKFSIHRKNWFKKYYDKGFRVKVALVDKVQAGFLYIMPIEICPWGPLGKDLLVVPCLAINKPYKGKGIGKALLKEAEAEVKKQGKKGRAIVAYEWHDDFWFIPAQFFKKNGYLEIDSRIIDSEGSKEIMMWNLFDSTAQKPEFLQGNYQYKPINNKVVVDLFFNTFCETSNIEAGRVREVVKEFGNDVILNEYSADNRKELLSHQIPRAIYINGKQIFWGYEAPREGIRTAIKNAFTNS